MWREKWRLVRGERDQSRAEEALLRKVLYAAREELYTIQQARDKAEEEVRELRKQLLQANTGVSTATEAEGEASEVVPPALGREDKESQTAITDTADIDDGGVGGE